MKRNMLIMAFAMTGMVSVQAQEANDTFIKIEDHDMFSQCFATCDINNDGIVTYAEAAAATMLSLEKGGRLNIIEDYAFLKYFPNLEALSVGNTTLEIIDMHYLTKLKLVNVTNALWLKTIIVGGDVAPEITGVPDNDPTREAVKVVFYKEKPDATFKFKDDAIKDFCLRNKVDADKDGVISKEEAAAVTRLSLMNFKSFMRNIKSYEDLQNFPNLEYFHAGMTYLETIDLSCLPKLKELDLSDCRMLKTIVLAKGCKPEIKYPVAYKGEKAKIVHKR
ncbi:MAG: leucine-rich repeat domain-containing protein [Prevotella sp.]|nr:leucine-rich repeat domain-containing protein [Prevotella sp.]